MKSEWHQVESQYTCEIDVHILAEIYPDVEEEELEEMMKALKEGICPIEEVLEAAWEQDVELDWDHEYDDWWTSRKGGYEVTYKIVEE